MLWKLPFYSKRKQGKWEVACHACAILVLQRCKVDARFPMNHIPFHDCLLLELSMHRLLFPALSEASKFMLCPHWTKLLHTFPRQNCDKTVLLGAKPTLFLGLDFSPSFSVIRELWKTETVPLECINSKKHWLNRVFWEKCIWQKLYPSVSILQIQSESAVGMRIKPAI